MKPARLLVNKLHAPVTVLGPGRRIGLWLQGCSIHCKGCVSTDTWDFDPRRSMTVDDVLAWCRAAVARAAAAGEQITGLTISGGEPFDQADGLRVLVDRLQKNRDNATFGRTGAVRSPAAASCPPDRALIRLNADDLPGSRPRPPRFAHRS